MFCDHIVVLCEHIAEVCDRIPPSSTVHRASQMFLWRYSHRLLRYAHTTPRYGHRTCRYAHTTPRYGHRLLRYANRTPRYGHRLCRYLYTATCLSLRGLTDFWGGTRQQAFEARGVCDPAVVSDVHPDYGHNFDTFSVEFIF